MIYEVVSDVGRWGPMSPDHPALQNYNVKCPECGEMFESGDIPAFVNPMPDTVDDMLKAIDGKAHTTTVQLAHEACVEKYRV